MTPDFEQNSQTAFPELTGLEEKKENSLNSASCDKPSGLGPRFGSPQLSAFQFKPGVSGNPRGRPRKNPEAPNAVKLDRRTLVRKLFEQGAEDVIKQTIEQAKEGDVRAQTLVLQYITPAHKQEMAPIDLDLAPDATLEDRLAALAAAATAGKVSPDSAAQVSKALLSLIEGAKILEAHKKLDSLRKEVQSL